MVAVDLAESLREGRRNHLLVSAPSSAARIANKKTPPNILQKKVPSGTETVSEAEATNATDLVQGHPAFRRHSLVDLGRTSGHL